MKVICHRESLLAACRLALLPAVSRGADEREPLFRRLKLVAKDESFTVMALREFSPQVLEN